MYVCLKNTEWKYTRLKREILPELTYFLELPSPANSFSTIEQFVLSKFAEIWFATKNLKKFVKSNVQEFYFGGIIRNTCILVNRNNRKESKYRPIRLVFN